MVGLAWRVAKEPRRSIPKGILTAWLISLMVYLVTAVWCSTNANPDELLVDKTIMFQRRFGPVVLAGVLCSTFMAASNLVAAPRLLRLWHNAWSPMVMVCG